jgi:drug/metabolite transporter (DMT)-like permease
LTKTTIGIYYQTRNTFFLILLFSGFMLLVFLLYALFGSVFVICKEALEYTEPLFLVGSRMAAAGLLICLWQLWRNADSFKFTAKSLQRLAFLAFFNIYLTNACEVWGLKYLSASKTCLIYSLTPFLAAFLSYLLFKEKLSSKKWLVLLIGVVGLGPIFMTTSPAEELIGSLGGFSWPELAVCIAAASSVYGWIILRQLINEDGLSFWTANGLSMLFGGALALSHSYLIEDWNPLPITEYLPFIECSLLLMVISNFACYNLYGYLLTRYTATFMSLAGLTTPLFAATFAWLYFGEVVTLPFYISMVGISTGLLIFYQEELRESSSIKVSTQIPA